MRDGWASKVARHVLSTQPALAIFFCLYMMASAYGIMNFVVGMVVQQVLLSGGKVQADVTEEQEMADAKIFDSLREAFGEADSDQSGTITIDEFLKGCKRLKGPARSKDVISVTY